MATSRPKWLRWAASIVRLTSTTVAFLVIARPSSAQCAHPRLDAHWRDNAVAVFRGQVIGKDTLATERDHAHVLIRVRVDTIWRFPGGPVASRSKSVAERGVPWVAPGVVGLQTVEQGGIIDSCYPESSVDEPVLIHAFQDSAGAWYPGPLLGLLNLRFLDVTEFEFIRAERARLGPGRPWVP